MKFHPQTNNLLDAIAKDDVAKVIKLLEEYPSLLNSELDLKKRTPLIYACMYVSSKVAEALINFGADKSHRDTTGFKAIQYAANLHNPNIYNLLNYDVEEEKPQTSLNLDVIKKQFSRFIESYKEDKSIFSPPGVEFLFNEINKINLENLPETEVLELFVTINSLLQIIRNSTNEEEYYLKLKDFLRARENVLAGDEYDYPLHAKSVGNQLCLQYVNYIFHPENPNDIVLYHAVHQGPKRTWFNPYTQSHELPPYHEFFRTKDNEIHLYEGVLAQAIAALKEGVLDLEKIWRGTDNNQSSLSPDDLNIIAARSPTFKKLVEYTKSNLENAIIKNGSILDHFRKLMNGLYQGGVHVRGGEMQAGFPAYQAVADFFEWWNSLEKLNDGNNIKTKILSISNGRMKEVIDILTEVNSWNGRSSQRFCVEILSTRLGNIINLPGIQNQLAQIDGQIIPLKSHAQLNDLQVAISKELEIPTKVKSTTSQFEQIIRSGRLKYIPTEFLTYQRLEKTIDLGKKLYAPEDERKMLNTIFSAKDFDDLYLTYCYVRDLPTALGKFIKWAILIKFDIFYKNHFNIPKNLIPYLASLPTKDEVRDELRKIPKAVATELLLRVLEMDLPDIQSDFIERRLPATSAHWNHAFFANNVKAAILLVTKGQLNCEQPALLISKSEIEWQFTLEYINQLNPKNFSQKFKSDLLMAAIANDASLQTIKNLMSFIAPSTKHIDTALNRPLTPAIHYLLSTNSEIASASGVYDALNHGRWATIVPYFNNRPKEKKCYQDGLMNWAAKEDKPKILEYFLVECKLAEKINVADFFIPLLISHQSSQCAVWLMNFESTQRLQPFTTAMLARLLNSKTAEEWKFVKNILPTLGQHKTPLYLEKLFNQAIQTKASKEILGVIIAEIPKTYTSEQRHYLINFRIALQDPKLVGRILGGVPTGIYELRKILEGQDLSTLPDAAICHLYQQVFEKLLEKANADRACRRTEATQAFYKTWYSRAISDELMNAAKKLKDPVENVQTLLKNGAEPNICDTQGWTPAMFAVKYKNLSFIEAIVNHQQTNLGIRNKDNQTAYTLAVEEKDHDTILKFQELFAKAIHEKDLVKVQSLLNSGLNPNFITSNGSTPLGLAVLQGQEAIVEKLLEFKADPDKATDKNQTPLDLAVKDRHHNIMKLLLTAGADPNIKNADGDAPLIVAGKLNNLFACQILLNQPNIHADVRDINNKSLGQVASPEINFELREMLFLAIHSVDVAKVKKLIDTGIPLKGFSTTVINSHRNWSLLSLAIDIQNYKIISLLLDAGVSPNAPDKDGYRPLWYFIRGNNFSLKIAEKLLSSGANINLILSSTRPSALLWALEKNNYKFFELALKYGANVNFQNSKGMTPLHKAVLCNDSRMVKKLLEFKADPNIQDEKGNTPLMYAINSGVFGDTECAKVLLEDPRTLINIPNNDLDTAYELASRDLLGTIRDLFETIKDKHIHQLRM